MRVERVSLHGLNENAGLPPRHSDALTSNPIWLPVARSWPPNVIATKSIFPARISSFESHWEDGQVAMQSCLWLTMIRALRFRNVPFVHIIRGREYQCSNAATVNVIDYLLQGLAQVDSPSRD